MPPGGALPETGPRELSVPTRLSGSAGLKPRSTETVCWPCDHARVPADLTLSDYATAAATLVGALAAALALMAYGRSLFVRTVGRRRDAARRLERLGTGAQLQFFESVLGEPPAMRRSFEREQPDWHQVDDDQTDPPLVTRHFVECFFIDPLYYVQTVSDADDTVRGFSISTRSRRFHPLISLPRRPSGRERLANALTFGHRPSPALALVELGRTKFRQALREDWGFPEIRSWLGARAWSYSEIYYFGNPGHYQSFAFTMSSASPLRGGEPGRIQTVEAGEDPWLEHDAPENWLEAAPDWIGELHATGVITTLTVVAEFPLEDWPTFGPHGDEVRTLP